MVTSLESFLGQFSGFKFYSLLLYFLPAGAQFFLLLGWKSLFLLHPSFIIQSTQNCGHPCHSRETSLKSHQWLSSCQIQHKLLCFLLTEPLSSIWPSWLLYLFDNTLLSWFLWHTLTLFSFCPVTSSFQAPCWFLHSPLLHGSGWGLGYGFWLLSAHQVTTFGSIVLCHL